VSEQTFVIIRPPEAPPISAKELRRLIYIAARWDQYEYCVYETTDKETDGECTENKSKNRPHM